MEETLVVTFIRAAGSRTTGCGRRQPGGVLLVQ